MFVQLNIAESRSGIKGRKMLAKPSPLVSPTVSLPELNVMKRTVSYRLKVAHSYWRDTHQTEEGRPERS